MRLVLTMCFFGIIGQIIGWAVFDYVDDNMLAFVIGGLAVAVAGRYAYQQLAPAARLVFAKHRILRKHPVRRAAIWCTLSGFSGFISLTGSIPSQTFLLPLKLPRRYYVGTTCWFFLITNIAKVPFFAELDMFTADSLALTIMLIPIIPVGVFMGRWLLLHLSDRLFYHLSHLVLLILGLRLLYAYAPAVKDVFF